MNEFDVVVRALSFAAEKHRNQRRKSVEETPYIEHPITVMRILWDGGVRDPVVLAAALLHDTLEDTDATSADLEQRFGQQVADVVQHCTDDKGLPKAERKRLTIVHAATAPARAQLVKLGDRIANCQDLAGAPPAGWSEARAGQYLDWSRQVVDAMRGVHAGLEARFDAVLASAVVVPWSPEASRQDEVDDGGDY
jgi:GTP diphosphokinase / guanosine-3',5'-bis(diphosphate) 3'-diphosphatase